MFRSKFLLTAVVAVAAALAAPARSDAAYSITFSETGGPSVTIADNQAGTGPPFITIANFGDLNPVSGTIATTGKLGDFTTALTATSSNSADNVTPAHLSFSEVIITNTSALAKTLTITITDTGFVAPENVQKILDSRLGATALSGSSSFVTLKNSINGVDGDLLKVTAPMGNDTAINEPFAATSGMYTVTMVVTITLSGHGSYVGTGDAFITPTPAPAGLVMLASALPFAGLLRLRRRGAKPEAATAA